MRVAWATFVRREFEPGWPILSDAIPLGQRYRVDLDNTAEMIIKNRRTGQVTRQPAVYVLDCVAAPPSLGYLPLLAFQIDEM